MANYSTIIPAEILLERDPTDTSCAPRIYDNLLLAIDEDGDVYLETRSYYGGDATPADEWHGRTLTWTIDSSKHGSRLIDRDALASDLAEGGRLAVLIDRVIAGHGTDWDGSNYIGTNTPDAIEAIDAIDALLADSRYASDIEVWDAGQWLYELARQKVQADWTDDQCRAWAAENQASTDPNIRVIGDASDTVIDIRDRKRDDLINTDETPA